MTTRKARLEIVIAPLPLENGFFSIPPEADALTPHKQQVQKFLKSGAGKKITAYVFHRSPIYRMVCA